MIPDVQSHFETPKKIGPNPTKSHDFLITLVVIMFLSGGYAIWFISTYLYAYDDTEFAYTPKIHRASAAQVATSTPSTSSGQADMTDWQTYRNEEYGFEFKHPELIEVRKFGTSTIGVGNASYILTIETKNVGRESVFDINSGLVIKNTTFAGKKAREYVCPGENKCPDGFYKMRYIKLIDLPQNWGESNEISYEAGTSTRSELVDQILSTFKFIP